MSSDEIVGCNRCRAGDSSHAVHEYISLLEVTIEEFVSLDEMLRDCLICYVLDIDVEMLYSLWEGKRVAAN